MNLYIGLMSGTSMDGVDAAIVDLETNELVGGITRPYGFEAGRLLNSVVSGVETNYIELNKLNTLIGREFGYAVNELLHKNNIDKSKIQAIGSHGQTVCHDATADIPYTIQLGCPHTISELTGLTVVADFRTRDIAAGGQGAPFAPLYHNVLFADKNLIVVNIGGIANVTILDDISSGFDVGPGNCLLDAWIKKHHGKLFDMDGAWARSGSVIEELLENLLSDGFILRSAPKSIGKEYFSLDWLGYYLKPAYLPEDVQMTLVHFTVQSLVRALLKEGKKFNKIAVCGGGVHNHLILELLSESMMGVDVRSSAYFNVDPDYIEAMMFAWLAEKAMSKTELDLSSITGSCHPIILGAIYNHRK